MTHNRANTTQHTAVTALERARDAFYADRTTEGITSTTLIWYHKYLDKFIDWLTEHDATHPHHISVDLVRAYLNDVRASGVAPKTLHHHGSAARAFCNFLVREGLLTTEANPFLRVRMPKVPKHVNPALTHEQVEALLAVCATGRDYAIILFMLDSGVRATELCNLNIGDVDTTTGAVLVRQGKGQKDRVTFIGARARKAVLRYLLSLQHTDNESPLWRNERTGQRLTANGLRQLLQRLGAQVGFRVHPHMLRRSFGIWALRSGMDVARVAALLGHADLQTVLLYLHLVKQDLADAHRQYGPVDGLLSKQRKQP